MKRDIQVGVLALQGDFDAHRKMLEDLPGIQAVLVRSPEDLESVDGLIIPGGESTTIGKLMDRHALMEPIRARAAAGLPVYGTCAGMILMAREIQGSDQLRLGILDVEVARNAFGRQVDSFEAEVSIPEIGEGPVTGVFIRAPYVTHSGKGVVELGKFEGKTVAVRQGNLLASAFHPELTDDSRLHEYFLRILVQALDSR